MLAAASKTNVLSTNSTHTDATHTQLHTHKTRMHISGQCGIQFSVLLPYNAQSYTGSLLLPFPFVVQITKVKDDCWGEFILFTQHVKSCQILLYKLSKNRILKCIT